MLAEAELWRYVSNQIAPQGIIERKRQTFHDNKIAFLDLFSCYECMPSTIGILRMIPHIIENQNEDGSWSEGNLKEISTHIVLKALHSIKDYLPADFISKP